MRDNETPKPDYREEQRKSRERLRVGWLYSSTSGFFDRGTRQFKQRRAQAR